MRWSGQEELKFREDERRFFWAMNPAVSYALVEEGSGSWLFRAEEAPTALIDQTEFLDPEVWKKMLAFAPADRFDLSGYAAKNPDLPAELFLRILGMDPNYRSVSDFTELSALRPETIVFGKTHDFHVNILRLFDRIPQPQCKAWQSLWEKRRIKKNLIREIIQDFYDLSAPEREKTLRKCEEFSEAWKAKSGVFPAEEIRDTVRRARNPSIEENAARMRDLKNRISAKGITLDIPSDLEAKKLTLRLEFTDMKEFQNHLDRLNKKETAQTLEGLFDAL